MLKEVLTSLGLLASPMTEPLLVKQTNQRLLARFEHLKQTNPTVAMVAEHLTLKMNIQRLPGFQHTPILSVHTKTHCQLVLNSDASTHYKYDYFGPQSGRLSNETMDFIIGHELGHCVLYAGLADTFDFYRADYSAVQPWKNRPGNHIAHQHSEETGKLHAEVFSDKFGLHLVELEHPGKGQAMRDLVLKIRQESSEPYSHWETFRFIDSTQSSHTIRSSQAGTY